MTLLGLGDDAMRRLLTVADGRDRAILLLLLDCGLRVSAAAGLRLGDLRPDGTLEVMGKGAKSDLQSGREVKDIRS